jgi:hypothetical protein
MSFGFGASEMVTLDATYRVTRVQVGVSSIPGYEPELRGRDVN